MSKNHINLKFLIMKTNSILLNPLKRVTQILLIFALIGFFTSSCKTDSDDIEIDTTEAIIDSKTVETQVEVNKTSESVHAIVEDAFYFEEIHDFSRNPNPIRFLPDCVTITTVITSTSKTVTLDFGDGCELPNGNFVSGVIILEYTLDQTELTKTIEVSFISFYFNDKNVAGNTIVTRQRENANGNPQSEYNMNITVTWPDGLFASVQGQRIREWIEGYGSGFWGDNVFYITGNWTFIKKNGNTYSVTIVDPLRREMSCKFIVSGITNLNKNGQVGTLDYGNGECDAFGILTVNGVEHTIHLRH